MSVIGAAIVRIVKINRVCVSEQCGINMLTAMVRTEGNIHRAMWDNYVDCNGEKKKHIPSFV